MTLQNNGSTMAEPSEMEKPGLALRRYLAFGIDWFVIAAWGGLLFGAVMVFSQGRPQPPGGPWAAQAIGFFAMTLPVILYFSLLESSAWGGSVGKRLLALRLEGMKGGPASFAQTLLRNLVKFAPWEFGHIVAQQAIYSSEAGLPAWVYIPMLLSFLGPLWWITAIFLKGEAPYDRLAGVRVVARQRH